MTGPGLVDKILAVHAALDDAGLPHAFGGALALAWCVGEVRATIDIDVNVFLGRAAVDRVLAGLPDAVSWGDADRAALAVDGQARLWWDRHPVDVFLNTTTFHEEAAGRVRDEVLADTALPFLDCADLAVFKVFFDRPKDWVDLTAMRDAGVTDWPRTIGVLVLHLGRDDDRIERLERLLAGG